MTKTLKTFALSLAVTLVATTAVNAQTTSLPSLEIITPTEGGSIPSNTVPILFNVENFEIVEFSESSVPVAGQGHIHVWLDDEDPTPVSATKVTEDVFTISDVSFGSHTLMAELVGNTHESLTPEQKVTVNFTNEQVATEEANITSGFDKNTALVIFIVVALVIVAAWWYTKEEDDEDFEKEKPKKKTKSKKTKKSKK